MALRTSTSPFTSYMAGLDPPQRAALEKLRAAIRSAAPGAEECISYQLAGFRYRGKMLVAMGATEKHCALYLMSSTIVPAHAAELAKYDTSKGTIRFEPGRPLPATLVKKLVKARIEENGMAKKPKSEVKNGGRRAAGARGRTARPAAAVETASEVAEFLGKLEHPLKSEIATVRGIVLGVSSDISEGIKWNSVSFRTSEWFATVNLRSREALQFVFHKGAKVKDNSTATGAIPDPLGMIKWLATDRCLVTVGAGEEVAKRRKALEAIVGAWIKEI
ncbi:MAG: DUF1801 domain-containing protein [Phycisphaerales bacterium]|nr:DUF1801 domain-containing protein [Phycisphaerales bacterium]